MLSVNNTDPDDERRLEMIVANIENITTSEVDRITDEINKYQPLMISLIMAYYKDFGNSIVFGELIKNTLMIWMYFKDYEGVKKKSLTEKRFNKRLFEIVDFFTYLDGSSEEEKHKMIVDDFSNMKNKMLMYRILETFKNNTHLSKLTITQKNELIIESRCLIESLAEV